MRRVHYLTLPAGCAILLLACDGTSIAGSGASSTDRGLGPNAASSGAGSSARRGQPLLAIDGPGTGTILVRRIAHPTTPGNFAVHIEAGLRHAVPNTSYLIQRAPEVFAPPGAPPGFDLTTTVDGSCQRGYGLAPWATLVPAQASFLTFPDQGTGSPVINTDADGNGGADFVFVVPFPVPAFDVDFRMIENIPAPTSVLQSGCSTLPV